MNKEFTTFIQFDSDPLEPVDAAVACPTYN